MITMRLMRFFVWILLLGSLLSGCAQRNRTRDYHLKLLGTYLHQAGDVGAVVLTDNLAYALASLSRRIQVFQLHEAAAPYPVAGDSLPDWQEGETFVSGALAGDSLLFAVTTKNVKLIHLPTGTLRPHYLGWDFSGQINHVFPVPGDSALTLFACDRSPEDGIQVHRYDLREGSTFWQYGNAEAQQVFTDFENDANDLVVSGDLIYVADGQFGLRVFRINGDFLDMNLTLLSALALPGDARRLVLVDGLLVIAGGGAGTFLVDVSDPYNPVLRSTYDPGYTSYDVAAYGGYAYIANGGSGVRVVDPSDPAHPEELYVYPLPAAHRIAVNATNVVVVDSDNGLCFFENPVP